MERWVPYLEYIRIHPPAPPDDDDDERAPTPEERAARREWRAEDRGEEMRDDERATRGVW